MEKMGLSWWRGKRVFVTGHTGFKGAWLCRMLVGAGAKVTGYALEPPTQPNLFSLADVQTRISDIRGDVTDFPTLQAAFNNARPEVVLHLAAFPLVRQSYTHPRETYATNVLGTVNILECVRQAQGVRSVLNVTTDKVYQNNEWCWGYRENERLDGYDPYSNSKSCSELVTGAYVRSFWADRRVAVATARAGNVIGGGDFAADRIIPDCIRAVQAGQPIRVRNPHSIRPYQHVLESLHAYLLIAARQYDDPACAGSYNIGPDEQDCCTTGKLATLFCEAWGAGAHWQPDGPQSSTAHEANFLKLDCRKMKTTFGWAPRWHIDQCIRLICDWTKAWQASASVPAEMDRQIALYATGEK